VASGPLGLAGGDRRPWIAVVAALTLKVTRQFRRSRRRGELVNLDERWFQGNLKEMPRAECLEMLAGRPVGRVAYCDSGGPVVIPVNYVLDGEDVLFRIASQSSLARGLRGAAAFQVDDFEEYNQAGWSVLIRGEVSRGGSGLPAERAPRQGAGRPGPVPWVAGERELLVRILTATITGRRLLPA
jgi:uncharacterized protein